MAKKWAHPDVVTAAHLPVVRRIGMRDLRDVLLKGIDDFNQIPTQLLFLGLIYPVVGIFAARMAARQDLLVLLYPLVAGLSLLGPVAAIGLYEISRRRERGDDVSWLTAFGVLRSKSLRSILMLGAVLLAIFVAWVASARALYETAFDGMPPETFGAFLGELFTTPRGWWLLVVGNFVGFLYAAAVLALTVVSFPLLLDRDIGVVAAVQTSLRAVAANPATMAVWGLIVAVSLAIGCLPFFVGLAVVMPILGHATWHLYRKVVA